MDNEIKFSFEEQVAEGENHVIPVDPDIAESGRLLVHYSCCKNPTCECKRLWLGFDTPERNEEKPLYWCDLVLDKKRVEAKTDDPKEAKLAKSIASRMTHDDWELGWQLYIALKGKFSENADPETVEVDFPQDVLDEPNRMLGYHEILPYVVPFTFTWKGRSFCATDRYCTNPECSCTKSVIEFGELRPETNAATIDKDAATVWYDYARNEFEIDREGPEGCPPVTELMEALRSQEAGIRKELRRRKHAMCRWHEKARSGMPAGIRSVGVATPIRSSTKVGRNERCPCGSGKKYKRCCGAK